MNRRSFLASATAMAAVPALGARPGAGGSMARIGLTTSVFRARFAQTKAKGAPLTGELKLADIPAFYADRFRIHNLEFWSKHFESRDPAYLDTLRQAANKSHSRLINLQIDDRYNLADANGAKRQESIALVKSWIDVAAGLGIPSARANTGKGEVETSIASLRVLNDYAKSKGVLLLVENHGGNSMVPANLLRILDEIDSPNLRTLPDFGNFPDNEIRYAGLEALVPHAHLISAKVTALDKDGQHPEYDFTRCIRIAEDAGFRGIYSIEQWTNKPVAVSQEEAVDWAIGKLKSVLDG